MGLRVVRVGMEKVNLKYIGLGVVFVLLVVGIPVIMDKYIIGNNVPSNIDNSDWVSFLGSYIGAVLGGIFTFIGIKITLYNKKTCLSLNLLTYEKDEIERFCSSLFLIPTNAKVVKWP